MYHPEEATARKKLVSPLKKGWSLLLMNIALSGAFSFWSCISPQYHSTNVDCSFEFLLEVRTQGYFSSKEHFPLKIYLNIGSACSVMPK